MGTYFDDPDDPRLIGLPTMKMNTPATLPGVAPPPASPAPIGVIPKPLHAQPAMSEELGMPRGMAGIPRFPSSLERQTDAARMEQERLSNTGPGVSQIHNPFLRGLARTADVIGSVVAPRIAAAIPGTTLHHQVLEGENAGQLAELENQGQQEARTGAAQAQAHESEARANEIENPQPKQPTNALELWMQQNPGKSVEDYMKLQQENKPEAKGTVVQTDQGPVIVNPGETEGKPVTVGGTPAKPPEKPGNDFEQFYKDYLTDGNLPDSAHNRKMARKEWAEASQAPQRAPQITVMVPNPQGGYTAQSVHPGQNVAPGAITPAGMSSLNVPTSQTRTMAETAPKVIDLVNRTNQLIDRQVQSLGPAASRWNEFMAGTVGAPNPEFTKLRTDIGLLQTALMRMHVGARGGEQIMEHFRNLIDVSKQSPENLKAALEEIREYANEVGASGRSNVPATGESSGPKRFTDGDSHWNIPADKVDAFRKAHPNAKEQ